MWNILWWLIAAIYLPACIGLIIVVLLQKGKGVGFAGAFGAGGGADTVFGPRSSKSLPQKLTYTMAGLFMFLALVLSLLTDRVNRGIAPEQVDDPSIAAASTIGDALSEPLDETAAGAGAADTAGAVAPGAGESAETPAPVTEETASEADAAPVETPEATPAPVEAEEAPEADAPASDAAAEDAAAEETPAP